MKTILLLFLLCANFGYSQPRNLAELSEHRLVFIDQEHEKTEYRYIAHITNEHEFDELDTSAFELIRKHDHMQQLYLSASTQDTLMDLNSLPYLPYLKIFTLDVNEFKSQQRSYKFEIDAMSEMCTPEWLHFLDLSFLNKMPNLEILQLQCNGELFNIQSIQKLKRLKYAQLPASIIHQGLFTECDSLVHISFGNVAELEFSRYPQKWSQIDADSYAIDDLIGMNHFSIENKSYRKFLKSYSKFPNSKIPNWNSSLSSNPTEHKITCSISNVYSDHFNWTINVDKVFSNSKLVLHGSQLGDSITVDCKAFQINADSTEQIFFTKTTNRNWHQFNLNYDFDGYVHCKSQQQFNDGKKHGDFIAERLGRVYNHSQFDNNKLVYKYPDFPLKAFIIPFNNHHFELFQRHFGPINTSFNVQRTIINDDTTRINVYPYDYTFDPRDSTPTACLTLINGAVHGNFIQRNPNGDTIVAAKFNMGKLHGKSTKFGLDFEGRPTHKDFYFNNDTLMRSLRYQFYSSDELVFENERIIERKMVRNEDGFVLHHFYLNKENGHYFHRYWGAGSEKLVRIEERDENYKIVYQRSYNYPEDNFTERKEP